jgi:gliding motility-associated-like protein
LNEDLNHRDQLFKDNLKDASMSPPPGVWEGVSAGIGASSSAAVVGSAILKSGWVWLSTAVIAISAVAIIYSRNEGSAPKAESNVQSPVNREVVTSKPVSPDIAGENYPIESAAKQSYTQPSNSRSNNASVYNEEAANTHDQRVLQHPHSPGHDNHIQIDRVAVKPQSSPNQQRSEVVVPVQKKVECNHSLVVNAEMLTNRKVVFKASGNKGPVTWYFGDGTTANGLSALHEYRDETRNFVVKAFTQSLGGCMDSALYPVSVVGEKASAVFIPDYLTPNGDGLNDELRIEIGGTAEYSLIVFDLNGRQVFVSNDPSVSWNGKSGIRECEAGYYNLILSYKLKDSADRKVERRRILLKR